MKISFAVAAAALVIFLAPTASTGAPARSVVSVTPACGQGVWPATAVGAPTTLVSSGASAVYVWVSSGAWHLRVKGAQSQPVTGQLSANAQLSGVTKTGGVRSAVDATGKRLTFTATGAGVGRLDLKASCATRIRFVFSSSNPGSAVQPRVYLGTAGQAPATSFALARPATTGVSGRILIGPTCPRVSPSCPPAKPVQGTVRIEQAPASRGGSSSGDVVARVPSDAAGNFSAQLAPGRYLMVVEQSADSFPRARPSLVDVQNGVVSEVTLVLDSGIR